jgi:hypothetical protein
LKDWTPRFSETEAYKEAVEHVRIFQDVCITWEPEPALQRKFIRFAIHMPLGFGNLLELHDPRPMVILAHQFALPKCRDHVVYFTGMADYHVRGIATLLPEEWQHFMEWPLYIVGRNQKLIECQSLPLLRITEIEDDD